eukprot:Sdes_comp12167_c0_seq1m2934
MAIDSKIPNPPAIVEYKNLKFMIMDAPSNTNVKAYIQELQKNNVKDVVRVCDPTYSKEIMEQNSISVRDWPFEDGEAPPPTIIKNFLDLCEQRFKTPNLPPSTSPASPSKPCIAVHCVAGLGRAPVLVAIALIEAGMEYEDTITFIRSRRRGAINTKQIKFLSKYRPKSKGKGCVLL